MTTPIRQLPSHAPAKPVIKVGDRCPKCGVGQILGDPRFCLVHGKERLARACMRCGFEIYELCLDNPERKEKAPT